MITTASRTRLNGNNNNQARHRHRKRDERHEHNGPPAGGELAPDHPVLRLEIALISQKQNQDADGQEGGAQRLAQMAQSPVRLGSIIGQRGIEPEQLRDGDAYRCECQRRPEPSEKRSFCFCFSHLFGGQLVTSFSV